MAMAPPIVILPSTGFTYCSISPQIVKSENPTNATRAPAVTRNDVAPFVRPFLNEYYISI